MLNFEIMCFLKMGNVDLFLKLSSREFIYYPIAFKFHVLIDFIKLSPKLEYELCPITKISAKMAATC